MENLSCRHLSSCLRVIYLPCLRKTDHFETTRIGQIFTGLLYDKRALKSVDLIVSHRVVRLFQN